MPGADLAAALAGVEVGSLDADAALGAAAEGAGLARVARAYPVLDAAVSGEVHHLDIDRLVAAEVRAAYGCSQNAAAAGMAFAEFLREVPAVAAALTNGLIRVEHARVLERETASLAGAAVRAAIVAELLSAHAAAVEANGSGWTMRQWAARIGRAVLAADPGRADRSVADTRAGRRVWHRTDTAHAEGMLGLVGAGEGPAGGVVLGQVTIPLSSLVGVDDGPGELAGVGPIPASVARGLMAKATVWRRLLTDPVDGHLVTQQIKSYRAGAAMRRFLLTRAGGVCSARGCGARHRLQADHVTPSPEGPTSVVNLVPQCPPDHNLKTHGGWVHALDPESGALTQTSPLGRSHTTIPSPPVAATGRRADPPGPRTPVPIETDQVYFPTGEPPPDPGECETGPPDPAADVDRWPTIAARHAAVRDAERRTRRDGARVARQQRYAAQRVIARAAARAEAAERALLDQLHAELESATDHRLITAINAEYLAEDIAA